MSQHVCSLHRELEIVSGDLRDYACLAPYHYRDGRPVGIKAVYVLRPKRPLGSFGQKPAGVIVYAAPNPRVELRTVATDGLFAGLDRQTGLTLLNRNVRCIARLVIEPRFRGVGLASRLVRETMPQMGVPIVEALGIMPRVNPFLEKAGMQAFEPRVPVEHVGLREALSSVGVEEDDLVDPDEVYRRTCRLAPRVAEFLEKHVRQFLKSHGTRRDMPVGVERVRYILSKLAYRPAYYIWFHPDMEVTMP